MQTKVLDVDPDNAPGVLMGQEYINHFQALEELPEHEAHIKKWRIARWIGLGALGAVVAPFVTFVAPRTPTMGIAMASALWAACVVFSFYHEWVYQKRMKLANTLRERVTQIVMTSLHVQAVGIKLYAEKDGEIWPIQVIQEGILRRTFPCSPEEVPENMVTDFNFIQFDGVKSADDKSIEGMDKHEASSSLNRTIH